MDQTIWGWKILRLWLGKFCDLGGFAIMGNSEIDEKGVIWVTVRLMVVMEESRQRMGKGERCCTSS